MGVKRGKVCLKDIANEVGVSVALVSYVLNNRFENRINKSVAQKIRQTAERLQYHPNQIAKSLKTSKTYTVGLVVADISNPFSSTLARILEDEGAKYGYTVIYGSSDENAAKFNKLVDAFIDRQVDGLILVPPENSEEQIKKLKKINFPFVILDRYFPDISAHYVNIDNCKAAYDAVQLLISSGKKGIGIIDYNTSLVHLKDRTKGYLKALKDASIAVKSSWQKEVSMDNDPEEIDQAIRSLLAQPEVNAIFFVSNRIAVHSLKYIRQQQIAIPQSLELISFDASEVFDFHQPQITYVHQPMLQLGQVATKLLMDVIAQSTDEQLIFIPAEIVKRGSTSV